MSETLTLTPAVLRALGEGVNRLRDGDLDDCDKADEVVRTMEQKGYILSGYDFVSRDWILIVSHLHFNGADKDDLTPRQKEQVRLLGDGYGTLRRDQVDELYDWSHVRDSSEYACARMATQIRLFRVKNGLSEWPKDMR